MNQFRGRGRTERGHWVASTALGAALVLVLALALFVGCGGKGDGEGTGDDASEETSTREATLYFPGPENKLYEESRELPATENTEDRVRAVVTALLEGPREPDAASRGLVAPFPEGVSLATVYRSANGSAFLDFESPEGAPPPAVGSAAELQIVYSVVNSVVESAPSVERVAILWNGSQPATLSGHVDIARPLAPRRGLIAAAPVAESAP